MCMYNDNDNNDNDDNNNRKKMMLFPSIGGNVPSRASNSRERILRRQSITANPRPLASPEGENSREYREYCTVLDWTGQE
jgi:hypothetical protein